MCKVVLTIFTFNYIAIIIKLGGYKMNGGNFWLKSAYLAAVAKLNIPENIAYDENGLLKPEFALTDREKTALITFIETEEYKKRDSLYDNSKINREPPYESLKINDEENIISGIRRH